MQHTETYGSSREPVGEVEANRLHSRHASRGHSGKLSTTTETFGSYLTQWLDDKSPTWKTTTERRNRSIVAHLPDRLAGRRLRDLTTADLRRYISSLPRNGQRRVFAVITAALQDAVSGGEIGLASNPALGVRLARTVRPEARPPTDRELESILAMSRQMRRGDLWADLFTFAAFTGLRRGELAALRWSDVDGLEMIHVRHAIEATTKTDTGSTWQLGTPKSHAERDVPIAQRARRVLARRRETCSAPSAFVFSTGNGSEPIHPNHISKMFAEAAQRAGVPDVQLKDLRSYAATVLASAAGLKVAQEWLGHRDVTTTARHYAGTREDAQARGIAALDAVGKTIPELLPASVED